MHDAYLKQRPKYFRVTTGDGRSLTFWAYNRPNRGDRLVALGGLYKGRTVIVTWPWSPFYRGYAFRAA